MNPKLPVVPGTQGYAEQAEVLAERYQSIPFTERHRSLLPLLPTLPGVILDIGAGTGIDAAWFAKEGHRVLAVEPTSELSSRGKLLHPSPMIEWIDDSLPELATLRDRRAKFNAVLLSAVWMHLDESERRLGMATLATLIVPDGLIFMTLRHGPVPTGRRMFDVSGAETVALAQHRGLRPVLHTHSASAHEFNRAAGVTWTILAFKRMS